jgi:small-conductance mechanosensitive channel
LGYVLAYLVLSTLPSSYFIVSTDGDYSILQLLSYGYANVGRILHDGARFDPASVVPQVGTTFWPEKLVQFFLYFAVLFSVLRYAAAVILHLYASKANVEDGAFDIEAIMVAVKSFIWLMAILLSFGLLRVDFGSLGLTTGLIGAGLTISFRDLLNNFFSGILLNLDRSIRVNDVIRMSDGVIGEVKKISLRYTFLQTRDNIDILVPNSVLIQNRFENLTRTQQEVRLSLRFAVGQEVDVKTVEDLVVKACMFVPEVSGVTGRAPALLYLGVSESANQFDLRFWVTDPRPGPAKLQSDVAKQIFKAFRESKPKIPLPRIRQFLVMDGDIGLADKREKEPSVGSAHVLAAKPRPGPPVAGDGSVDHAPDAQPEFSAEPRPSKAATARRADGGNSGLRKSGAPLDGLTREGMSALKHRRRKAT